VQADLLDEISEMKPDIGHNISISEDIVVGQTSIFMPFSNNVYVGVYHKDEERTICNMSGLYQPNYLLNIDMFNSKTRELLKYLSFYSVNVPSWWL